MRRRGNSGRLSICGILILWDVGLALGYSFCPRLATRLWKNAVTENRGMVGRGVSSCTAARRICRVSMIEGTQQSTGVPKLRRSTQGKYEPNKILPLIEGGSLIIGKDGWFIDSESGGVGNFYGDQAIPLELEDHAAWLLYRDGEVIRTVTEDELDVLNPLTGGSYSDPLQAAKSGGFIIQALSTLMSWGQSSPPSDPGIGSRFIDGLFKSSAPTKLRKIAVEEQESFWDMRVAPVEKSKVQRASEKANDVGQTEAVRGESVVAWAEAEEKLQQAHAEAEEEMKADPLVAVAEPVPDSAQLWGDDVQKASGLMRDANARMEVGLLEEAAVLAREARDLYVVAFKKGFVGGEGESVVADRLAVQAIKARVAQKEARSEAKRLTEEAEKWLQTGDLETAIIKARRAQEALKEVEENFGRVSAMELTRVVEVRVRAEEKVAMRREAAAAAQASPNAKQAESTKRRQEAEAKAIQKVIESKKSDAAAQREAKAKSQQQKKEQETKQDKKEEQQQAKKAAATPTPTETELKTSAPHVASTAEACKMADPDIPTEFVELGVNIWGGQEEQTAEKKAEKQSQKKKAEAKPDTGEWRDVKALGASLDKSARLALKEGNFDRAQELAKAAIAAFKEAGELGYRKAPAEMKGSQMVLSKAALAKESTTTLKRGDMVDTGEQAVKDQPKSKRSIFDKVREAQAAGPVVKDKAKKLFFDIQKKDNAKARAAEIKREESFLVDYDDWAAEQRAKKRNKDWGADPLPQEKPQATQQAPGRTEVKGAAEPSTAPMPKGPMKWIDEEEQARQEREQIHRLNTEAIAQREREMEEERKEAENERRKAEEEERAKAEARMRDDMLRKAGVSMGTKVLATYYGDGYEYEALVLAPTNSQTINLVFIGYGDEQETKPEDIRLISELKPKQEIYLPPPAADGPVSTEAAAPVIMKPTQVRDDTTISKASEARPGTQLVRKGGVDGDVGEKSYELDVKYHGILLGKQGVTVKALQQASGATIRFVKEPIGLVVISGTKFQRDQAWALLQSVKRELPQVLTMLREKDIQKGDLTSQPELEGEMDKDKIWSLGVAETMARIRGKK